MSVSRNRKMSPGPRHSLCQRHSRTCSFSHMCIQASTILKCVNKAEQTETKQSQIFSLNTLKTVKTATHSEFVKYVYDPEERKVVIFFYLKTRDETLFRATEQHLFIMQDSHGLKCADGP